MQSAELYEYNELQCIQKKSYNYITNNKIYKNND